MRYYNENDLLTVKEVSHILKLSELTIYKYIKDGQLEALAFGGHYRVGKSSLSRFIQNHIVKIKAEKPYEKK